ncbi:unnamed protein product [Coccothraustes coccothraustes]
MDFTSPPLSLQDNGFSMVPPDPRGTSLEEMEKLKEELRIWKTRVEDAEKVKADLNYSKLRADVECERAEKKLTELKEQEKQRKDRISSSEQELLLLKQENTELKKEIEKLKEDLEEHSSQDNPIKKKVAEMKLKFTHLEEMKDDGAFVDMDTRCVFGVATKTPFRLNQNQALLTFEDEEVAQRLTKMSKHCVNLDSTTANVTVKPFELDMGFQFELHVTVSGKKINVSDIPELPIPDDWMRDKLELHFYKTEQAEGGGEIENVTYNKGSGTGVITFLNPGASYKFVGCTKYPFCGGERWFIISVSPHFDFHLRKVQPHCRVSKKTILLKGIPEVEEDEESVQDMIEIHFQKPSNGGGEIEQIKYISRGAAYAGRGTRTVVIAGVPAGLLQDELLADILTIHFQLSRNNGGDVELVTYPTGSAGVAYVTFEEAGVVERVLKKDQHLLQDKRLPRPFPLTVTRYCHNAFLGVTSTLNMAVFRDHVVLEDLVEEMKKQSPALSFGPLQRDGQIAVQGSFPALRVLRDFLLLKAKSLSEEDRREGKSHQRARRKLQEHRGAAETRTSTQDAQREKQVLVLDTDIYHYMKCFYPKAFQGNDVVISGVTDGDITTVCIESAGSKAGAAQGSRARKMMESYSVELQKVLRKERICFREASRAGRQRHRQLCEKLKARFPRVLLIPYDTHLDVVGTSADVLGFTEEVKRRSR